MLVSYVAFACSSSGNRADATKQDPLLQAPNNTSEHSSIIPGSNPPDEIVAIAREMLAQRSYRAVMETAEDPKGNSEVEFVAPDRVRARTKDVEQIAIGANQYMKVFGVWRKIDLGNAHLSSGREEFEAIVKFGPTSLSGASFAGEESVMGEPALVYLYTIKREMPPLEYDVRIWASKTGGLPIKVQYVHRLGPPNMMNKKKVTTYSDYGAEISIEPPPIS
jgi:hypothetical protein